jgi:hypothetical protein
MRADHEPTARRSWTTGDERQLEQLWLEGLSVVQIALRTGRSERAISKRAQRLGLSVPRRAASPDATPPARRETARRRGAPAPGRRVDVAEYHSVEWAPHAPSGHGLRWAWRARVGEAEVTGATAGDRYHALTQARAAADRLLAAHQGRGRDLRAWQGDPELAGDGGVRR